MCGDVEEDLAESGGDGKWLLVGCGVSLSHESDSLGSVVICSGLEGTATRSNVRYSWSEEAGETRPRHE